MNVVLSHGLLGFRNLFKVGYFQGIANGLRQRFGESLNILITETPPIGTVEKRSGVLGDQIQAAFLIGQLDPKEPLHLIGHSMGGLDARRLATPANLRGLGDRIASVTTISTPHRGSPLANLATMASWSRWRHEAPKWLQVPVDQWFREARHDWDGIEDLRPDALESFNQANPDHPSVFYQAVAAIGREGPRPTCLQLAPAHWLITKLVGNEPNDGGVTVTSAQWGPNPAEEWHGDHFDMVNHNMDRGPLAASDYPILEKYCQLVERLSEI